MTNTLPRDGPELSSGGGAAQDLFARACPGSPYPCLKASECGSRSFDVSAGDVSAGDVSAGRCQVLATLERPATRSGDVAAAVVATAALPGVARWLFRMKNAVREGVTVRRLLRLNCRNLWRRRSWDNHGPSSNEANSCRACKGVGCAAGLALNIAASPDKLRSCARSLSVKFVKRRPPVFFV